MCGTCAAETLTAFSEHCDTEPGHKTYLIGGSDESKDVHLRVRLHVITEQGMEVRNGRQCAVFIGHTVQIPRRRNEPHVTGRLSWNAPITVLHTISTNPALGNERLEFH